MVLSCVFGAGLTNGQRSSHHRTCLKTFMVAQSCDLDLHVILDAHLSLACQLLGEALGGSALLVKVLCQEKCGARRAGCRVSLQVTGQ